MKRITLFMMVTAMAIVAVAAARDDTQEFKKFYKAGIPMLKKAFKNKDISFFENASSDDFSYKHADGKIDTKEESMAGLRQMFGISKSIVTSVKVGSIKVQNDQATVTNTTTFSSMMKTGPKGGYHRMRSTMWMRESWKKSDKGWTLTMIEETRRGKYTMDGKPVDPSKMMGKSGKK